MGLDMYLDKKIYIGGNYEHNKVTGTIDLKRDGKPVKVNLKQLTYITERAGYWRKCNQIHKWFVDNVQEGEDDCKEYYVDKEKFEQLLLACKTVKENKGVAVTVLPTESGFFFGSTDYDEYYMRDIENTITIIEDVLKDIDEDGHLAGEYYYHSSW